MTYGLYAGISAADLGYEPDLPVATCPKCDGEIYHHKNPPRGLVCISCGTDYNDLADVLRAEAYYRELWDEANEGPAHPYEDEQ